MKYAVDRDEEREVRGGRRGLGRAVSEESPDTEITLGTRSLLGIFFGLVLICGIFFGLGYSVGRVSSRSAAQTVADTTTAAPATSLAKPSPQEAANSLATEAPAATDGTTAVVPAGTGTPATASAPNTAAPATAPATTVPAAAVFPSNPVSGQASSPAPSPAVKPAVQVNAAPAAGAVMVQVAAVSIPQDADILVGALRQHGYHAVVRRETGDSLLHIQIGPFATRAQAEAMRGRLLADGYNAVLR